MQEPDLYTCSVIPYLIKNMMNMREYKNLNCAYRLRYIAKRAYAHCPSILSGTLIESLRKYAFRSKGEKRPQSFIIHQRSDFILHCSFKIRLQEMNNE